MTAKRVATILSVAESVNGIKIERKQDNLKKQPIKCVFRSLNRKQKKARYQR